MRAGGKARELAGDIAMLLLGVAIGFAAAGMARGQALVPEYDLAYGVLAAPDYGSFAGYVPAGKQLDFIRRDAVAWNDGALTVLRSNIDVWGSPGSNTYGTVHLIRNFGAGMASPDEHRCEAGAGGGCIAQKLAVRNNGWADPYFVRGQMIGVGAAGVGAAWWVQSDEPGVPASLPNVTVVAGDVRVTGAVLQWNVAPGTTGDLVRVYREDGSCCALRIDRLGNFFTDGAFVTNRR